MAKTRVVGRASTAPAGAAAATLATRTRQALSQPVQLLRKLEVLLRDPVLRVADERYAHQVPGDEQVRVVVELVCDRGQPVHEVHRPREVVELELAPQRVAVLLPVRVQLAEVGLHLFVVQDRHLLFTLVRIVSLVPSATETLFALGLGDDVVAVTHECDYPPEARDLPHVTRSIVPEGLPAADIDRAVRELTSQGRAIYELDENALHDAFPDLIVTQA